MRNKNLIHILTISNVTKNVIYLCIMMYIYRLLYKTLGFEPALTAFCP